jgi:hypothetical protein
MERLIIKAFRANEDPNRCARFVEEHRSVLSDIGVAEILPPDTSWAEDESTIVVVAEHPVLGMVGGCRLQFSDKKESLPFHQYLSRIEPDVLDKVDPHLSGPCGELCGLWVANRFTGRGLPWLLTAAAISVSTQTEVNGFVCLSAEYSMEYACRNGFRPVKEVGHEGRVAFPIPTINSYLLVNNDPIGLRSASDRERYKQFSLRLTPDQRRVEQPKEEPLEVQYLLQLSQRVILFNPNRNLDQQAQRRSA